VVIGGLISNQVSDRVNKVPILGDIPILGFAFKRKVKSDVKTELLIFLTPHVVQNPEDLARISTNERQKMDLAPKVFEKEEMERYIGKP
jgi:type II secretory pathway component GspD/PulD (secretin)